MITINVERNANNEIVSFSLNGHAGYNVQGKDIVCAAVSAVTNMALIGLGEKLKLDLKFEKTLNVFTGKSKIINIAQVLFLLHSAGIGRRKTARICQYLLCTRGSLEVVINTLTSHGKSYEVGGIVLVFQGTEVAAKLSNIPEITPRKQEARIQTLASDFRAHGFPSTLWHVVVEPLKMIELENDMIRMIC